MPTPPPPRHRWALACVLAAAAAAPGAAQARCLPEGWTPAVATAAAWAETRTHGLVAFSVRSGHRAWHHRPDAGTRTASVAKAVMLAAQLRALRDRPVPPAIARDLDVMVRRSDDAAADRARARLGDAALEQAARAGGMTRFRVGRIWGGSRLTARDGARLMHAMPELLPARHRAYGLRLLRTVVPSQRWGIGRAVPAGWTLHLKGGWGSASGLINHQVALLTCGEQRVALAILTTTAPDHAYGTRTLRGIARRLLRDL